MSDINLLFKIFFVCVFKIRVMFVICHTKIEAFLLTETYCEVAIHIYFKYIFLVKHKHYHLTKRFFFPTACLCLCKYMSINSSCTCFMSFYGEREWLVQTTLPNHNSQWGAKKLKCISIVELHLHCFIWERIILHWNNIGHVVAVEFFFSLNWL